MFSDKNQSTRTTINKINKNHTLMSFLQKAVLLGCLLPLSNASPFKKGKTITVTKTVTLQPIHDYKSSPTTVPEMPIIGDEHEFEEQEYPADTLSEEYQTLEKWDEKHRTTSTWDDTYASTWAGEYTFSYTPMETSTEEIWNYPLPTDNAVPQWVTIDEEWVYPPTKTHEKKEQTDELETVADTFIKTKVLRLPQTQALTIERANPIFVFSSIPKVTKSAYETSSPVSTFITCTKTKECEATPMATVMKSYSVAMNKSTVITSYVKFNETDVSTLTFHPFISGNGTFGNNTLPAFSTGAANAIHGRYNYFGQVFYLLCVALFYLF